MSPPPRIYLDNAATTWPKPESVYQAMDTFHRETGVSAGRGGYWASLHARDVVDQARFRTRQLLAASAKDQVLFGFNGTDVLNLGIQGLLRDSGHVISSVVEHNSILRPLHHLMDRVGIDITWLGCDPQGVIDLDALPAAIRPDTCLIALSHASNVTGAIQPLAEFSRIAREHGVPLLIDAAQSAGVLPIDLQRTPVDLLATSGHKGLLGPLGTGILVVSQDIVPRLQSIRQGGTGSSSDLPQQPDDLPEKFEAGSMNTPGIAGLSAGIQYVQENGIRIREHELGLTRRLLDRLREIPRIRILGPPDEHLRTGVVTFAVQGGDCHEVAQTLEVAASIQVRAGLMCAPKMHAALGCPQGAVRVSFGPFNRTEEVDMLVAALESM